MGAKSLRKELKKEYRFVALKNNSIRSFRIMADDESKAESKAKTKYVDWSVSFYGR